MKSLPKNKQKGVTLIALIITIIVLIILAGIAISMTVGDNGIFTKAKEAKRLQITAETKEKIGTEILDAQVEAVQKNEQLQQSKVEEIIAKYGELQADGDTIKLKDNGYEISLKEIYSGTTSSTGGSTGGSAELDNLKAELAQTTATEDKVLKDYKAYSNGKLITGTMENYAGKTVTASTITENGDNAEITIPSAGYYGTDSKVSIPVSEINALGNSSYKVLVSLWSANNWTATEDINNGLIFFHSAYDQGDISYVSDSCNATYITSSHFGTQGYPSLYKIQNVKKGTILEWRNNTGSGIYTTVQIIKID